MKNFSFGIRASSLKRIIASGPITATGGSETRPVNIAVNYYIKVNY